MRTIFTRLSWCFIACLSLLTSLSAQDFGRVGGTVTDTTGAAIAGAAVHIINTQNNAVANFTTNEQGRFTADNLAPGAYRIEATAQGFKQLVQTDIAVHVGDSLDLKLALQLGAATESITVSGGTPVIETATSATGAVIEPALLGDLPLNERQPFTLAVLAPGVIPNRQIVNAAQPFNRAPNFSISGGRGDTNEILLDGTPDTIPEGSTGGFRAVAIFPTVEGIQEFKVQTNSMAAEYGGSGGGIVNIVTRAGSNQYHGVGFDFLRNSVMDANGFFSNANHIPLASFKRNQFGAAFGGPVSIPKLYDGKNKTFVFVSWEDLKQLGAIPFTTTVPTDMERAGDFSQYFNAAGQQIVIYDPATTVLNSNGTYSRTAFPGNVIPAARLNAIAKNFMSLFPEPTSPGLAFTNASNFNKTYTQQLDDNRVDVRLDQNIGDKQRLFFAYAKDVRTLTNPNVYGTAGDPVQFHYPTNPDSYRAGYLYSISPSWVAEVRYAYNNLYFGQIPGSLGYDISQLGFPSNVVNGVQEHEFPRLTFSDLTGTAVGMGGSSNTQTGLQNSNVGLLSISHNTGNHAIKFGTQIRRDFVNRFVNTGGDLKLAFSRTFTQGPNALAATSTSGSSIADALLGLADTSSASGLNLSVTSLAHSWWQSYYVQDDWHVSNRLTLNYGLRWDLQFPMVEANNNYNWFNPNIASPIQAPGLNLMGGFQFASDAKRNPYIMNQHDVAPRFGLAYRVNNNLVLRAAYGIFYAPNPYDASGNVGNGYSQTTPYVGTVNGATPINTISTPFPNGLVPPLGNGAPTSAAANLGLAIAYYQPKEATPYMQQWNIALQQQLGKTMAIEVAYDGMKGNHLTDVGYYLSQLQPSQLGPQVTAQVTNPFYGTITTGTLSTPTVTAGHLLAAFPQYASVQVFQPDQAFSNYDALLVKLEKRMSHGVTFLLAYTFSKLLDDGSGTESFLEPATGHQNAYNRRADYAVSDQNVPQRFVFSFTYAVPFGRGRTFGHNWSRGLDGALGGWALTGILTLQSGIPLSMITTDTSQSGSGYLRPNSNGQNASLSGSVESRLGQYFNTADFSQPAPYTFGNVGRNLGNVYGPGEKNLDFSVYKDVSVKERVHLQIRAEAFNLTNHPWFSNPDTNLQDPTFGKITTQFNSPRQIQLSLRLSF